MCFMSQGHQYLAVTDHAGDSGDRVQEADCAGEEKEAIMLKAGLPCFCCSCR